MIRKNYDTKTKGDVLLIKMKELVIQIHPLELHPKTRENFVEFDKFSSMVEYRRIIGKTLLHKINFITF